MSYASVLGQQMYVNSNDSYDGTTTAGNVATLYRKDLIGTYLYTVKFSCTSTSIITSATIICGNSNVKEAPHATAYSKTLTGVFTTGEFLIQTIINVATTYDYTIDLLKIA